MTPAERQQSLINARLAVKWLRAHVMPLLDVEEIRNSVQCLIDEFNRLDIGEQTRNAAGREHGHLGRKHANNPPRPGKRPRGRPKEKS